MEIVMRRLFGTDGIRGIANEFLSCERAIQIGRALGTILSSNRKYRPCVLIGMDTRVSSEMLASAISAGLCSVGSDCVNLGVVPTPAVAYLVQKYGAKAGVMISASHNPYPYNGIKIFGEEGFKLSDELEEQIESIVLDNTPPVRCAESDKIGRYSVAENAISDYVDFIKSTSDISLSGMRIAIDCANGSASATARALFSSLGAECHMLSATPNGVNINEGCGSTDLGALKAYVKMNDMDVGIAFDGDADRFLAVDELGREVDGDFIMAILALELKKQGKLRRDTVVGTIMTNFGFGKFCEENGIRFIAANVGDRYVLETLNREGYCFGGEQSGHIIFRDFATTGDGQLTALALLSVMKRSGKKLSELCSVMKRYPQRIVNIRTTPEGKIAMFTDEDIKKIISSAEEKIGGRGRIVVRPSGTEPVVRIMIEGEDEKGTVELCESVAAEIGEKLKEY